MRSYQDLRKAIETILRINTRAFKRTQSIGNWVKEIREQITKNRVLLDLEDESAKLKVLKIFFRDIIQKGVPGETCMKVERLLDQKIKNMDDLTTKNYKHVMKMSGYRFPNEFYIWDEMVAVMESEYNWNWRGYVDRAERNYRDNFKDDAFLKIKGVGVNVRNLCLSNFSPHFPKIDKHIKVVFNRLKIGELVIGKQFPNSWGKIEKLHPVFVKVSDALDREYSETDLDRIFWHFGREICTNDNLDCALCRIEEICPFEMKVLD